MTSKRDLARYDGAQQNRRKDENDRHGVLGLSMAVNASDPTQQRKDAITRDGREKSRRGHHGYGGYNWYSVMRSDIKRDGGEGKSFVRRGEDCRRGKRRAYHDETDHGDDGHEDAWTFAKGERVQPHERLRGVEREENVQFRNEEQEEDGGDEFKHTSGDRARDDSSTGDDTAVANKLKLQKGAESVNANLFSNVAGASKAQSQSSCPR